MSILTDEEIEGCSNFSHNRYQFARAIESAVLSKLAEQDVEPVAWQGKSGHLVYDKAALMPSTRHLATPLYTESQLLAAQQRTAEACAKVCNSRAAQQASETREDEADKCADLIRNGDWREYL